MSTTTPLPTGLLRPLHAEQVRWGRGFWRDVQRRTFEVTVPQMWRSLSDPEVTATLRMALDGAPIDAGRIPPGDEVVLPDPQHLAGRWVRWFDLGRVAPQHRQYGQAGGIQRAFVGRHIHQPVEDLLALHVADGSDPIQEQHKILYFQRQALALFLGQDARQAALSQHFGHGPLRQQ